MAPLQTLRTPLVRFSTRRLLFKSPPAQEKTPRTPLSRSESFWASGDRQSLRLRLALRAVPPLLPPRSKGTRRGRCAPWVRHLVRLERATDSGGPMRSWGTGRVYG
jgi:hypothetical protein